MENAEILKRQAQLLSQVHSLAIKRNLIKKINQNKNSTS